MENKNPKTELERPRWLQHSWVLAVMFVLANDPVGAQPSQASSNRSLSLGVARRARTINHNILRPELSTGQSLTLPSEKATNAVSAPNFKVTVDRDATTRQEIDKRIEKIKLSQNYDIAAAFFRGLPWPPRQVSGTAFGQYGDEIRLHKSPKSPAPNAPAFRYVIV